jgi:formiminotetrahydrofolate cyclodeaminase
VLLNVDANTELLDEDGIREQAIEKRQQLEQQASKCLQLIRQALQDRQ